MRRSWLGLALAGAVATLLGVVACGNDANSLTACRELEDARCERAQACGIDLSFPLHTGSSAQDNITACQLFYQDACLHGLVTTVTPTNAQITSCLKTIQTGSCTAVIDPQSEATCAWLNPPDAGVDAGVDASKDAATTVDVTVVVVVVDSGTSGDTSTSTCNTTCESQCVGDPVCINACGC